MAQAAPQASHRGQAQIASLEASHCRLSGQYVTVEAAQGDSAPLLSKLALQVAVVWPIPMAAVFLTHTVQFLPLMDLCFFYSHMCRRGASETRGAWKMRGIK